MSIPLLIRTYEEVRRLAIAGSGVAPGDFRLQKLLPQLAQVGQKAPVFAKVGEAVQRLIESTEQTSAAALLELAALVQAILYTQGETKMEGTFVPLKTNPLGQLKTQTSARVLKPLQEALTTTGPGRLEIIRDAQERGAFDDMRLVAPALVALDDSYGEIADLVADQVLPRYGPAIVPELQAQFDPKGRAGQARRLRLLHRLDPEQARAYVQRALDEGSAEVRIAAIGCLGDVPDDLPLLLEQVKARAKEVRNAALQALARSSAGEAVRVLCAAITGPDLALAVEPLRQSRQPAVTALLLKTAEKQFDASSASKEKDARKCGPQNERLGLLLECLKGRTDPQTEKFLLRLFAHADQLAALPGEPSGQDVVERLVSVMVVGSPAVQAALIDAHARLPAEGLAQAFAAACHAREPAEVFALFSPYLTAQINEKKKQRDPAYAKREALIEPLLLERRKGELPPGEFSLLASLDPQWLDLAIELGRADLVQALAVPGHAGANALLSQLFRSWLGKPGADFEVIGLLDTMIRVQHPEATNAVIDLIKKFAKAKFIYGTYWMDRLVVRLPRDEALPKLEALLPTLPEKMIDPLLKCVTALKQALPTARSS